MEICQFKVYIQKDSLILAFIDKMAEWLFRMTVNPLRFASALSNPSCHFFIWFWGEMDSNFHLEFSNQSSNLGKKLLSLKPQLPPSLKFKKKTDDNVENNGQVIMPGLETGTF